MDEASDLSYYHEPSRSAFKYVTIPGLIEHWAAAAGDREAYVVRRRGRPREAVTFRGLRAETERLAGGLLALGLRHGDVVMMSGASCLDWLLCELACACVGVVVVHCRQSVLSKEGLLTVVNSNRVRAVLYNPGERGEFEEHLRKCIPAAFDASGRCPDVPCLDFLISMGQAKRDAALSVEDVKELSADTEQVKALSVEDVKELSADTEQVKALQARVQSGDTAAIYMTSGSTGFPKAIPYSHFRLLNAWARAFRGLLGPGDRLVLDRPPAMLGAFVHASLTAGATAVYLDPLSTASAQDVAFSLQVMHEEQTRCGILLQYLLLDILEMFESGQAEPIQFEWVMTGGEVIQDETLQRLKKYVKTVSVGYAASETLVIATSRPEDPLERTARYAGHVAEGVEVKVVDGGGRAVPFGQRGEIVVRSPLAFPGYLHAEARGMSKDRDGWVATDDSGYLTRDGYVKVFGRMSDVVSRGITLIYPSMVEEIMLKFTGVLKVAVVGVPDRRLGQELCAAVIPAEGSELTAEDLKRQFREHHQTDEGLGVAPGYYLLLAAFPRRHEKVDRAALRDMAVRHFNLSTAGNQ